MYPMYYGFDWTYVVLVLPCVLLSLWASANVNSTFKKYAKQYSCRGLTGAEAAQRVLYANGIRDVQITRISGNLTDHYDPRDNVIRLSDSVYGSTSTAAIGVACHEAGHAVQYAQDYAPIKLRAAIIPELGRCVGYNGQILILSISSFQSSELYNESEWLLVNEKQNYG